MQEDVKEKNKYFIGLLKPWDEIYIHTLLAGNYRATPPDPDMRREIKQFVCKMNDIIDVSACPDIDGVKAVISMASVSVYVKKAALAMPEIFTSGKMSHEEKLRELTRKAQETKMEALTAGFVRSVRAYITENMLDGWHGSTVGIILKTAAELSIAADADDAVMSEYYDVRLNANIRKANELRIHEKQRFSYQY